MRRATLASAGWLVIVLAGCTSEQLRNNQQGWREAECDKILDTRTRERCLKEARQPGEEAGKK